MDISTCPGVSRFGYKHALQETLLQMVLCGGSYKQRLDGETASITLRSQKGLGQQERTLSSHPQWTQEDPRTTESPHTPPSSFPEGIIFLNKIILTEHRNYT